MELINKLYQSPNFIKRENSEPSEGCSSSNSLQMLFQTMAPTADTNVAPSNSSVAKVNPAQQTPALSPSFHVGKKAAHPSEDDSQYSDLQSGKGASLTPQSNSRYSGHNLDESVSSEYLPYSPAEFGGGEDSNTRQEAKLTMKTQPLELARSSSPKNNTANAEAFGIKRSSGNGDVLPSAKRLATSSYSGYGSIPQQHPSANFMSPVISQLLSSTEEIARRLIAQAHRPSMARKNGRAAQPEDHIKVEEASNLYPPTHSARSYNHDQQYYEATPQPRVTVPPSAEASHRQRAPASFSGILAHLQGHAATNPRSNELEIAPIAIVKNEEDAPPPHQATPLATNPTHVSFEDELDHLRWEMRRMSRKMARQAACAEVYAADSHARNVDANRKIAQFDGVLAALRNEVVGLRSEVLGLKIQGLKSERGVELEGLRGEVVRLGFEVIRLERDALRREVGELRRGVL